MLICARGELRTAMRDVGDTDPIAGFDRDMVHKVLEGPPGGGKSMAVDVHAGKRTQRL